MQPAFEPPPNRPGLLIEDPIESVRFALYTPDQSTLRPADPKTFHFPVDAAVEFETKTVEIPKLTGVYVRTRDGDLAASYNVTDDETTVSAGAYTLELNTAPMKLYLTVESGVHIEKRNQSVILDFDEKIPVRVGARSFHEQPAGTVTVTDDIEDSMRAISLFGSALKTTSPERSFPTLRGHPPLIERGDDFSVPDGLERPETGVELVVPRQRAAVYTATPLAYYLGAKVVPGRYPRLAASGFEHPLTGSGGFENAVANTLQQVFFFDCLTRTEGYYQVDLYERQQIVPLVELDFAALYDASLAERLAAYLSVPFETLEPHLPDWHLTTDVVPAANNVESLPFVANDLSLVRCPPKPTTRTVRSQPKPLTEFYRADFVRSTGSSTSVNDIVQPDPSNSVEHVWIGDGYPLGSNKTTVESCRRRIEGTAPDGSSIEIHVVCNDERMEEEGVVNEFYGSRDLIEFDVGISYDLTTDELAELFAKPLDFVHYIGHVDDQGMQCSDGYLDVRTLDVVRTKAFLLNACRSYEQGMALVENGSRGGVVTLSEIANVSATKVGRALARLLNIGFSLRTGLEIAKSEILTGYRYITVGDGGLGLVQCESGCPLHLRVRNEKEDSFEVDIMVYPSQIRGIGTLFRPHLNDDDTQYLNSGVLDSWIVSEAELDEYLNCGVLPVTFENDLYWSDEITAADLR
ncbi:hypothetical protein ACFFQF_11485 [Haladaptatus pallidirubidus]|uniref:Caspase domain-containing protein n=1 Tax=Haladaptatus pallidirubidus TaxID=1008152 RepID=A0AAV3UE58_9EURY|nr:hypothetical protein [Haladaptatus pallidirubidus]